MDLGLRFKLFRISAGKRQQDVAEALGVSANYVSMIERGKREPTLRYLREFADFVKAPAALLLWDGSNATANNVGDDLRSKVVALMAQYAASTGITSSDGGLDDS